MTPAPMALPSETMARSTEIIVTRRQMIDGRLALESQRSQASLDPGKNQLEERITTFAVRYT
ncbi:hypothetical protein [uncultured Jannaschia sp.]|uniref:hypothetical protein n=1 Tax=uncultured Jannaschia sp. TaxID=293347 RepID=UPI00261B7E6A|nr:hypothetical protein [uncultured Jannaschia sp.]